MLCATTQDFCLFIWYQSPSVRVPEVRLVVEPFIPNSTNEHITQILLRRERRKLHPTTVIIHPKTSTNNSKLNTHSPFTKFIRHHFFNEWSFGQGFSIFKKYSSSNQETEEIFITDVSFLQLQSSHSLLRICHVWWIVHEISYSCPCIQYRGDKPCAEASTTRKSSSKQTVSPVV